MPTVYRILGQLAPGAASLEDIYTAVKPVRSAIISSINVANRDAAATEFRIAVCKEGAAISDEMYIAYDTPIAGNDTISYNIGITLGQGDVIRVYNTLATVSFSVFGLENA